jgi:hypothetical protein
MDDKLKELVEGADRRAKNATLGPWQWWTSCSFRRLSSVPSGKDGDVAYATIYSDGHPGIEISDEDAEFIEKARVDVPALCVAILELDKHARHAEHERDVFNKRIDELEAEVERLRENGMHEIKDPYLRRNSL